MMSDDSEKYPIGKFAFDGDRSAGARNRAIADIAELPENLRNVTNGMSDEQLDTPYRDGGWTVRQVVHHVPDSHLNAYMRFKLGLTEDNPTIKPYAEAIWATLPDTHGPTVSSLTLLDGLHARWVDLMRSMAEAEWERSIFHPEAGRNIHLYELLPMYAWHGKHHVAHVSRLRERKGWN